MIAKIDILSRSLL